MTRSGRWLWCLAIGLSTVASSAIGQEPTSDTVQKAALAESLVAREEAGSGREFDPAFRARAKELLAARLLAELASPAGEGGLGLNSLGDSQADLVYTPVTPCRIIDTRLAGGVLAAGTTRSFLVTGSDYGGQGGSATGCGVPFGPTTAAVVNFVAVDPTGAGNLSVTPFGSPMPLASIINFRAGVNLANGLTVAICDPASATCSSDVTIQANNATVHLVADVQGYFRGLDAESVPRGTAQGVTIPAAGMAPVQVTGVTFTAKSYGNVLVRARGYCNMGPTGAGSDDAIELGIGINSTDAFNDAINPPSQWGVLRIPASSGAHRLMFSAERVWPTGRGATYFLGLFGRHAAGSVAEDCSASLVVERNF